MIPMPERSEKQRLQALFQLKLLDTPPSDSFDRITRMASRLFGLPIAAVSLTDKDRQWFKSRIGVDHWEIPRERAPCAEVAETAGTLVVPDLLEHSCYRDSLLAKSGIRFYAGAPLMTRDGHALGAMCVLGTEPRTVSPEEHAILSDLAAMVMAQIELQHAVGRIEPISGLPNRSQLLEDLEDKARDQNGTLSTLVIIDLADASQLQQTLRVLGPIATDDFVRNSVASLSSTLGTQATIYHIGVAQLAWIDTFDNETNRQRMLAIVHSRFERHLRNELPPGAPRPAIGIAPFLLGSDSSEAILRAAHNAVQDARNSEDLISIYSPDADEHHRRRFRLIADMRDALLATDQLTLVYQPKVCMSTGECVGAEALLRWQHPHLGAVSPGEFIPLIEQTELAGPLTDWVIGRAIRQIAEWGASARPISINVSPPNLEEVQFAQRLLDRLTEAGLPRSALEIEVTESAIIRHGARVRDQLEELRAAGIKVAIDDFGTGYSSLSYLQTVPADIIKIDQSFVRELSTDERARTLVRSLVAMARGLDFRVVAEGIEDESAYAFLREAACDEGQGYWLSRPIPADGFLRWVNDRDDGAKAAA